MNSITPNRKSSFSLLLCGIMGSGLVALPVPQAAAATYEVGVDAWAYLDTPQSNNVISSTTGIYSQALSSSGHASAYANGSAGAGYLGAYATTVAGGSLGYAEASAGSNFILNDLMFSSGSPSATQVTTSLNFVLHGNIFGSHYNDPGSYMHSRGSVSVGWQISSGGITYYSATGGLSYWSSDTDPGVQLVQADGFLADLSVMPPGYDWSNATNFVFGADNPITLNDITLDLNRTYQLTAWIYADVASGYSASNGGNTTQTVDFANTLSFPTSGVVFNLPEGFSVNSVDGAIVDNQWIDPRPSAVPLPAAFWLFGSGLLGLIGIARHKRNDGTVV